MDDPRDCSYQLSEQDRKRIDKVLGNSEQFLDEDKLDYSELCELHKQWQRADPNYNEYFYELVARCKCISPLPRANKELDERLRLLKKIDSQRDYQRMTSKFNNLAIDSHGNKQETDTAGEFRYIRGAFIAVINSFLVFICTFIFCYKAIEYAMPDPHVPTQVMFGVAGSTVVAIAELYFLFRVI